MHHLIHEARGIKHALFVIAEFLLTQPVPDGGMTYEQKAALSAKAAAICAKLDKATAEISDNAAQLDIVK